METNYKSTNTININKRNEAKRAFAVLRSHMNSVQTTLKGKGQLSDACRQAFADMAGDLFLQMAL